MKSNGSCANVVIRKVKADHGEPELRESDEQFRELMAHLQQVFWIKNAADDAVLYISPAYETIWGRPCQSLYDNAQTLLDAIHPEDRARVDMAMAGQGATGGYREKFRILRPDGAIRWIWARSYPVRDGHGQVMRFAGIAEDITEVENLEEQFRQAQKMEALGRLAMGVAHDFNNLITIISGYSELLLEGLPPGDPAGEMLLEIRKAGARAASLTHQLLGFSRKRLLDRKVADLNAVVAGSERMLRQLVGEDVDMVTVLDPALSRANIDTGQMEQVLMNLVINARDAMPGGGKITIETTNMVLDQPCDSSRAEVKPGRYVMLAVSDTGSGMDDQTRTCIFEPFFTTKKEGKGTGLGLAMIYGFIKQSEGHIVVYSEPGFGSTFKIYLPEAEDSVSPAPPPPVFERTPHGDETILLVEDELAVRSLARRILQKYGYTVLEAAQGDEAIRLTENHPGAIQLLVTDVVMLGLDGRRLADRILAQKPGIKVLFLSGYADAAMVRHGILASGIAFLQKPFTPNALARKVRDALDQGGAAMGLRPII